MTNTTKTLLTILAVLWVVSANLYASPMPIDPDLGWTGYFAWDDGVGQIDDISLIEYDYDMNETEWSLTLANPGYMTMATAYDGYVPGDEFALHVDGGLVPWTTEYIDGSGFYHGEHNHLDFSAGTHTMTIFVTALAPGYTSGAAHAYFSPVVPEPATLSLLAIGAVALIRRRSR